MINNQTPKGINGNFTISSNQNTTNSSNNQNIIKKPSNQSNVNNSRSKSKNNDNKTNSPNLQPQLKISNSSNLIDSSKSLKKNIKENPTLIKKDYSTLNENNSVIPFNRDEKVKTHMSKKSINVIEKSGKNLEDLSNFRVSPSLGAPFKKYSVSPNQKHPLESIIKEDSCLFEEEMLDAMSYREMIPIDNLENKTQKITIRTSNTTATNVNGNSNLLGQNTQQKNKSDNKSVGTMNTSNNINILNKKNLSKKNLIINNSNSEANLPTMISSSVKNINSNLKNSNGYPYTKGLKNSNLKDNMKSSQTNFNQKIKSKPTVFIIY
jgi:hypothetical protein